jgi:DNA-binding beta-propeller fold protein YncE
LKRLFFSQLLTACAGIAAFASGSAGAAQGIQLSGIGIAPESLTSTSNGTIFVGTATRKIYRADASAQTAVAWTEGPGDGPRSIFGVFADERTQVLWACAGSVPATSSELYAFDLNTGELKRRYPLPTSGGICNDIAVSSDGTVFATDSTNMQVLRLRSGARRLEVWAGATPGTFGEPNGIIDGIAVLGSRVFVNTLITRKLFGIEIGAGGEAGTVSDLELDHALDGPDGMRSFGRDTLLVAVTAGDGALAQVVVNGNKGSVKIIRQGFERGAVAVTIAGGFAYVLGNRPIMAVKDGEAGRFEAVRVALP